MLEQSDLLQFIVTPPDEAPAAESPAAMLEAVFDEKTAGSICSLFDLMDVAEAEIDAAMRRRSEQSRRIYNIEGGAAPPAGVGWRLMVFAVSGGSMRAAFFVRSDALRGWCRSRSDI